MPSLASPKTKVTVTLSSDLVDEIDKVAGKLEVPRSQLIEQILRRWQEEKEKRRLEKEIEEYYLGMTEEEQQEDKEWTNLAVESAKRFWDE